MEVILWHRKEIRKDGQTVCTGKNNRQHPPAEGLRLRKKAVLSVQINKSALTEAGARSIRLAHIVHRPIPLIARRLPAARLRSVADRSRAQYRGSSGPGGALPHVSRIIVGRHYGVKASCGLWRR